MIEALCHVLVITITGTLALFGLPGVIGGVILFLLWVHMSNVKN